MSPNETDKLAHFTEVITNDALDESRKILEEIQRESAHVMSAAEDEYLAETFRFIKGEISLVKTQAGRRVSHKIMENKRALYLRREEMSEAVLSEVRARIDAYVRTPAYETHLCELMARVMEAFGFQEEITVYLRHADMPLMPTLAKAAGAAAVHFEEGSFELGGLTAICPRRHLQIDESFDATLGELHGHFAEMFGLELAN